ncbi:MAG: amidohydrolase [Actinomycetota bacterium]|nr:amidohydrolase [Actinomycetota bacterium]
MASRAADLILTGGAVYTMDAVRSWAEAVAVSHGRIIARGSAADLSELRGPGTVELDCRDRLVLPAFQDAHVHALWDGLSRRSCDLHHLSGKSEYQAAVKAYADKHPELEWIDGDGWSMEAFPSGTPHRTSLDEVVSDRPVFLVNRDGHGAWANSKALELAGITGATSDPSGGRIERDADGEPMGTLHEHAMDLVERLLPKPSLGDRCSALEDAQVYLHSLGITAWQDPSVTEEIFTAYKKVNEQGGLSARVSLDLLWERDQDESQLERLIEMREEATAGRLRASGIKFFVDGVAENFTAGMIEPYLGSDGLPSDNYGMSMIEPAALARFVTLLDHHLFQVHFHAIGDRATREALDAVEQSLEKNGRRDSRHHICHLQVVQPQDIPRFRALGVVANCQPLWACDEPQMRELTIPFLGEERAALQYPFASLHRAGAVLAFGSDWTVSTPDPLEQIEVAVNRVAPQTRELAPFLPQERLSLPESLAAFTIGSAFVNRLENVTGSIEEGKDADLVVLDRDPFDPESGPIGDASAALTLVEGTVVHQNESLDW